MHQVDDEVYGVTSIPDGLLSELVKSRAVQRLRKVSQAGASSFVRTGRSVTRFEHSLGVMTLTGLLGGSEVEQAAGLLQDVSHTAFSHTIDYLFDDRAEGFHEKIFDTVVEQSDLPEVLLRHGLTWQTVFGAENLVRVDASAPLLCADRIDYTLRDLVRFGHISAEQAREFVNRLKFIGGRIVVDGVEAADNFVGWYRYLVGELFMNPLELFAHDELADILKQALRRGVIEKSDLLSTDDVVLGRLESDDVLAAAMARLKNTRTVVVGDTTNGRPVRSKARIIDPPVLVEDEVMPLSKARPSAADVWSDIERIASDGLLVSRTD